MKRVSDPMKDVDEVLSGPTGFYFPHSIPLQDYLQKVFGANGGTNNCLNP